MAGMNAAPLAALGQRQQQLLTLLLEDKDGMTAEELARALDVSKSAVHQHTTALERDGYLRKVTRPSLGGRPSHAWQLTDHGMHLFPKHYAVFSNLLIDTLRETLGSEELIRVLRNLGRTLAEQARARVPVGPAAERIEAVARLMREFGYQAEAVSDEPGRTPTIVAQNCVFHDVAKKHAEVCELDLALMTSLTGTVTEQTECMLRGGTACRFKFGKRTKARQPT